MLKVFVTHVDAALECHKGISLLAYAILAGALLGLVSVGVTAFGTNTSMLFTNAGSSLSSTMTASNANAVKP
jgi:hypothetical protein